MKVRFRGFDNPALITGALRYHLTPCGSYTQGQIYEPQKYNPRKTAGFHYTNKYGLVPDMYVEDDTGKPFYVESMYWDLIEEEPMTLPFETVTAIGDHGSITFRKSDGLVVARDFNSGYEDDPNAGYPFVLRADPATLTNDPMDVLHVGYYFQMPKTEVCYEPPIDMEEDLAPPLPKTEKPMKPMKPFDLAKAKAGHRVVTRDGRRVRILTCELNNACYTIVAIITANEPGAGSEIAATYTTQGEFYHDGSESQNDLFMAPVKCEGWVNLYPPTMSSGVLAKATSVYATKGQAEVNASPNRLACIRVEWEE